MLCQKCGKHVATTHVKKTINGETTELHLCSQCAQEQGLGSVFGGMGFDLGDFWGSLFDEPAARALADTVRCEGCGSSFQEIVDSGKVGCPVCYTTFYDRLLPSIQRIHGKAQHVGKLPSAADEDAKQRQELDRLKRELAESISRQEYEKCAELRDRIRALETQEKAKEEPDGKGGDAR